jgi:2-keto-3-deoxy-6-phosphogluconate aldolase
MSAVKELLRGLKFIITDWVETEKENLRAGSVPKLGVGMGIKLITKSILEKKKYSKITELSREAMQIIQTI